MRGSKSCIETEKMHNPAQLIEEMFELNFRDGDWWYATNMATGQKGYIPNSYVVKEDSFSVHRLI